MMTIAESSGYRGGPLQKAAWWVGFTALCLIALAALALNGFR